MLVEDITELIGNTPILRIPPSVHGLKNIDLFAKLEMCNPFGSVKDRIAQAMVKEVLPELAAHQKTLIENSSGNTAKALGVLARRAGVPFRLVTAMTRVSEVKDILRLLGVDIEEVAGTLNCFDPNDPNDPQYMIQREVAASEGKLFFTSQFSNELNPQVHYETTGAEILRDLGWVDFLCSGLGTSGTTLGISKALREKNPALTCIGITADSRDFIPGIRSIDQMWSAGIFAREHYQEYVTINSATALEGMLTLLRSCGIMCGPSSGAHFAGSLAYLRKVDPTLTGRKSAVFVVCDRIEWYLSYIRERRPELFKDRPKEFSLHTLTAEEVAESRQVQVAELDWWKGSSPAGTLIIDTRAPMAFNLGTIPDAINIPVELLEQLLEQPSPFCGTQKKALFVCPVGLHSRKYAAQLSRVGGQGFSLAGGMRAFRAGATA